MYWRIVLGPDAVVANSLGTASGLILHLLTVPDTNAESCVNSA